MTSNNAYTGLIKLNLGCGLNAPSGWINIDSSFTARLSKIPWLYWLICKITNKKPILWPKNIIIYDVRKGLPFLNESVEAIFSSHMLEHMTFEDANFVIKECYRCLCKRGIIRIIVPDLYEITKKYIDLQSIHPKGSNTHNFLRDLNIFREQHTDIKKIIYEIFSHSKHLYMYDEWSLRELLEKHGFYGCQKMNYGQSRISDIRLIESEERHKMSICLEGVKE